MEPDKNKERDKASEAYAVLFMKFSDSAQRLFRKILIGLLICLCAGQLLLRIPGVRDVLSAAERWEGERPKAIFQAIQQEGGN